MCFFDQYRYECGDWKWGNFHRHCQSEYRMGETCGMKLVYDTKPLQGKCRLCDAIDKKMRRYEKTKNDYNRWCSDPARKASAAKAYEEMKVLAEEMKALQLDIQTRRQNVVNTRRPMRMQAQA